MPFHFPLFADWFADFSLFLDRYKQISTCDKWIERIDLKVYDQGKARQDGKALWEIQMENLASFSLLTYNFSK